MTIFAAATSGYYLVSSYLDLKRKKLPLGWLFLGGILLPIGWLFYQEPRIFDRVIGGVLALCLFGISFLSREAIGKADCVLILLLMSLFGFSQGTPLLLGSFFLCSIVSGGLFLMKRAGRKTRIPFVPFLTVPILYWFLHSLMLGA